MEKRVMDNSRILSHSAQVFSVSKDTHGAESQRAGESQHLGHLPRFRGGMADEAR